MEREVHYRIPCDKSLCLVLSLDSRQVAKAPCALVSSSVTWSYQQYQLHSAVEKVAWVDSSDPWKPERTHVNAQCGFLGFQWLSLFTVSWEIHCFSLSSIQRYEFHFLKFFRGLTVYQEPGCEFLHFCFLLPTVFSTTKVKCPVVLVWSVSPSFSLPLCQIPKSPVTQTGLRSGCPSPDCRVFHHSLSSWWQMSSL